MFFIRIYFDFLAKSNIVISNMAKVLQKDNLMLLGIIRPYVFITPTVTIMVEMAYLAQGCGQYYKNYTLGKIMYIDYDAYNGLSDNYFF